jgi:hypothetical protein
LNVVIKRFNPFLNRFPKIENFKIGENPKIKGIKVLHSEHEISHFADDTSVILDGSEESLNETLLELEWFKKTLIPFILGFSLIFSLQAYFLAFLLIYPLSS